MPENSANFQFTQKDAVRVLKEHFKVKDVRSVKEFTGSSERSKVYIGLIIGEDGKTAVGAGVLKMKVITITAIPKIMVQTA